LRLSKFTPGNIECELIFGDIHVPYEDKNALKAIHHYIKWRAKTKGVIPVTGITSVGDLVEFAAVSRHNEGKRGLQEGLRLKQELDAGVKLLGTWRELLGPEGSITLVEGNHEHRVQAYLEKYPELKGILSVPELLKLDELGVKWVPYWSDKT